MIRSENDFKKRMHKEHWDYITIVPVGMDGLVWLCSYMYAFKAWCLGLGHRSWSGFG